MAFQTRIPTAFDSPDPTQGGNAMGTANATSCSGGVIGLGSEPSNSPTYRAYSFQTPSLPNITSLDLRFSYSVNIAEGSTGSVTTVIEYSLDGGSIWTTSLTKTNSSETSTRSISLSLSQNIANVRVRAHMTGGGPSTGDERQMTMTLTSIRIDVGATDPPPPATPSQRMLVIGG